jgi:hypothetical protein
MLQILFDSISCETIDPSRSDLNFGNNGSVINEMNENILSTLSTAFTTLAPFRHLLQHKLALQTVLTFLYKHYSSSNSIPRDRKLSMAEARGGRASRPESVEGSSNSTSSSSASVNNASSATADSVVSASASATSVSSASTASVIISSSATDLSGDINKNSPTKGTNDGLFKASANWDTLISPQKNPQSVPEHSPPSSSSKQLPPSQSIQDNTRQDSTAYDDASRPIANISSDDDSIFEYEGERIYQLISSILQASIVEFGNPNVFYDLLAYSPQASGSNSTEKLNGFQIQMVTCFKEVVDRLYSDNMLQNTTDLRRFKAVLVVIISALNSLIPLISGLNGSVRFELLKLAISILVRIDEVVKNKVNKCQYDNEKEKKILNDVKNSFLVILKGTFLVDFLMILYLIVTSCYIYIYACIRMHIFICGYICIYIYVYIHVYIFVCVYV